MDSHAPRVGTFTFEKAARRRIDRIDGFGIVVVFAFCVWTIVSAAASGGEPIPSIAIVAASSVAFVATRLLGALRTTLVPALVVGSAAVLAVVSGPDAINGRAAGDPLGYANANGALWLQATAAALLLVAGRSRMAVRAGAAIAAVVFAGLTFASGSLAASVLLAVVVAGAIAGVRERATRWFVIGAAALVGVSLWTTIVLGAGYRFEMTPPASQEFAEDSLSIRRLVLWRDAVDLMRMHPVTGVGPGRFSDESWIAVADPDTTETHNEFLQQGAETGIPGIVLTTALVGWVFLALRRAPRPRAAIVAGAAAAVAIHATVDYIFHFPTIPVVAAALVGTACATRKTRPPEGEGTGSS